MLEIREPTIYYIIFFLRYANARRIYASCLAIKIFATAKHITSCRVYQIIFICSDDRISCDFLVTVRSLVEKRSGVTRCFIHTRREVTSHRRRVDSRSRATDIAESVCQSVRKRKNSTGQVRMEQNECMAHECADVADLVDLRYSWEKEREREKNRRDLSA